MFKNMLKSNLKLFNKKINLVKLLIFREDMVAVNGKDKSLTILRVKIAKIFHKREKNIGNKKNNISTR
jgi:hypothetical protein